MSQFLIKDSPKIFNVSGKDVFFNIISTPSSGWPVWASISIGVATLVAGLATGEVLAVVAALVVLLTITPSICVFTYYYNLLASDIVTNVIMHSVERHFNGFLVRLYKPHQDANGEETSPVSWTECGRLTVYDTSVVKVKRYFNYYLLYLVDAPLRVLYVPADFFLQLNYENS